MQRLQFSIKKGALVINDLENNGSLHITFKPYSKPSISPAFEAWNDLESDINSGKLNLRLFGFNTIREQKGFLLKGLVTLSSSHLYEPSIENGHLHLVSLRPKCEIKNSTLSYMGITHFGVILFNECTFDHAPKRVSDSYSSYYRNQLI